MEHNDSLTNEGIPPAFYLSQNYPNPFMGKTTIKYCVAYRSRVRLTVVNPAGEVIETLVNEEKNPGTYAIDFAAGVGPSGEVRNLAAGHYSYRIEVGDYSSEKKMEVLK